MTDDPLNPADTLRRITGAWVIPHNLARIAGWVNTNRDAINAIMVEATRQPTIGERLYPISAGPVRTLVPLNIPFEHLIPAEMQFPRHLPPMSPLNLLEYAVRTLVSLNMNMNIPDDPFDPSAWLDTAPKTFHLTEHARIWVELLAALSERNHQ